MAGKKNTEELLEFDASGGVSSTADPYASGDSTRSADKPLSAGEMSYSDTTRAEVLNAIMNQIGGMNKNALINIYKAYGPTTDNQRGADNKQLDHEVSISPTSAKGQSGGPSVNTGGSAPTTNNTKTGTGERSPLSLSPSAAKASYREDVEEIFGGDELSEEIRNKASIVFEAAINARLVVETARLEEEFEAMIEEAIDDIQSEIVENVDKYLSYAVEEWVEENKVAIDAGLKVEMAEDLIYGLKGLFEDNYIDIPETKVDVVAEMAEKVEELENQLNEQIEKNHNLRDDNNALMVERAFVDMTEGLAETQIEKLRTLSEGVSYNSAMDYKNKLTVIKETYFPSSPKPSAESTILTEEFSSESDDGYVEPTSGPMAAYVKAATKLSKSTN